MSRVAYGKLTKQLILDQIERDLGDAKGVFITRFSHVPAGTLSTLRQKLSKKDTRLRVIKNSLGRRAIEKTPHKELAALIDGKCALGFSRGDAVPTAKTLVEFAHENKTFIICGARIDGELFDTAKIKQLAALPGREELLAKILGGLQAPVTGFVTVLGGVMRGLVRALDQIRESKGKS